MSSQANTIARAEQALARVQDLAQVVLSEATLAAIAEGPLLENWHVSGNIGRPILVGMVAENGVIKPNEPYRVYTSALMALSEEHKVASTQNRFYRLGTPATAETMVDPQAKALARDVFGPMMDEEVALLKDFLAKQSAHI